MPWLLSSSRPNPGQRRLAAAVALLALAFFAALAPFAGVPLAPVPAFLPIYESALVVCDLVTTVLLFGQFAIAGSRGLMLLAAGYLFGALMAIAHALSFPGLFGPAGWMGAGPQTTAWLYFLWHAGFPVYILGYTLAPGSRSISESPDARKTPAAGVLAGVALAVLPAFALIGLATAGQSLLPPIMAGDKDAPLKVLVASATWLFALAALVLLWRRRARSVLDLWLMVVLCAWMADSALAAVFNHARYDVGWYAGRVFGLLASAFVLAVLLLENGVLHARLAQAHRALAVVNGQLEIANRDLNRFVGAVAHDLQQPILSISGYAQQVRRHTEQQLRPTDLANLQRIIAIAANADRMVQDLLQFARLGQRELDLELVDLNQLVEDARTALAREMEANGVQLQVVPLPHVRGDASLLSLAFVNLLSNAIKYSRGREPPLVQVDAPEDAEGIAVRIRDNGVGFDMAHAARLFTPFERLHSAKEFEGTGMGLANVRRIMERHGGAIRAESAPGAGASFWLVFPRDA